MEVTKLMLACQKNSSSEVSFLIENGADVNKIDGTNRTALFYCAENTNNSCIEQLLKAKANLNHQDKDGFSCLHLAVIYGNKIIVEYLIKNGADVNITDSEMHSVIHWAVVCGQAHLFEYLLQKNADPETPDVHGAYPIHYAAQMCGNIELLDEQINRDTSKSLSILRKLIEQKVKVDVEDYDQRNALIWAASSGSSEALIELYKAGSDPNKHEKDGLTALHCASSRGHLECIQVLVNECLCSVDIMDNNNCTPIFYAATLDQADACGLLIHFGANLHVQDCKGRTVFHCAAAKGKLKCLKLLCQKDSSIWVRNRRGDYPIHESYYNKKLDCVEFFLDAIPNNQAVDSANLYDGRTLLHLAAADNNLKLCKKLVERGLDVNCLMKSSSNSFMTPYEVAKLKQANDCEKYLKSMGGQTAIEVLEKQPNKLPLNKRGADGGGGRPGGGNAGNAAQNNPSNPNSQKTQTNPSLKKPKEKQAKTNQPPANNQKKNAINNSTTNASNAADTSPSTTTTTSLNKLNINKTPLALQKSLDAEATTSSNNSDKLQELRQLINKSAQTNICSTKQKLILIDSSNESLTSKDDDVFITESKSEFKTVRKNTPKLPELKKKYTDEFDELENKNDVEPIYSSPPSSENSTQQTKNDNETKNAIKANNSENKKTKIKSLQMNNNKSNESIEITVPKPFPQKQASKVKNANKDTETTIDGKKDSDETIQLPKVLPKETKKKKTTIEELILPETINKSSNNDESFTSEKKPKKSPKTKKLREKPARYKNGDESSSPEKANDSAKKPQRTNFSIRETKKKKTSLKEKALSDDESSVERIWPPAKSNVKTQNSKRKQPNENDDQINNAPNPSIVKLIIKSDDLYNLEYGSIRKRNLNSFEQQRLILKSLYEIRRCRINNRNIIINSELNNLLVKNYNFDIIKNCRSLKDLEKTLEMIAMEISVNDFKKSQKRSQTLATIKTRNFFINDDGNSKSYENIVKPVQSNGQNKKDEKTNSYENQNPSSSDSSRLKNERLEQYNNQLKLAYKSQLPNDIYRQYFNSNNQNIEKVTLVTKEQSPREKSIFLPVISQKQGFST